MDSVYAKKDMLVPGVINAYPVIMDTRTANHVVALNTEVHLQFVTHRGNVPVYQVLQEEHVNNVVQGIINIPNANVYELIS